jgi:hypothetical protein
MPRRHVRDLVRHYSRQLRFTVGFENQARIDEKESTAWH